MSKPPLRLGPTVLDRLLAQVQRCGAGRNECVVYVTAALDAPDEALELLHPTHRASAVSVDVDVAELQCVWSWLRTQGHCIVLQVHTHPGSAHHSGIDDEYPIVHALGFRSLVLARFGEQGLRGAHLAVYEGDGRWCTIPPDRWTEHLVVEGALDGEDGDGSE